MTVELAHPSTEPLASRSPTTPAHPRWWFFWTTPGRILTIGVVLSALVVASAFATSTTINDRQAALTTVLNHTEPLSFAAGQLYTTLSVADAVIVTLSESVAPAAGAVIDTAGATRSRFSTVT